MDSSSIKYKTIDEYIASFPPEIQLVLSEIRKIIRDAAPEAIEAISYQMPTFKLNGNLIHFAAFKNHIGIYPTPTGIEEFKKELTEFTTSKGAIQFPYSKPFPYELLKRIVNFRVSQNRV